MPDLQEQLNQILSNPEALKQVQSLGVQLGLGGGQGTGGLQNSGQTAAGNQPTVTSTQPNVQSTANALQSLGGDALGMITKFAPILSSLNNSDDTTRLLGSLRPFLSPERRGKLDRAEKMLKLFKLVPLLKENGLF